MYLVGTATNNRYVGIGRVVSIATTTTREPHKTMVKPKSEAKQSNI